MCTTNYLLRILRISSDVNSSHRTRIVCLYHMYFRTARPIYCFSWNLSTTSIKENRDGNMPLAWDLTLSSIETRLKCFLFLTRWQTRNDYNCLKPFVNLLVYRVSCWVLQSWFWQIYVTPCRTPLIKPAWRTNVRKDNDAFCFKTFW